MSEEATTSADDAGNVADANAEAATATTSEATNASASNGEGDWRSTLPDDVKESETLSKFSSVESLAKSYINLEKTLGSDKVVVPKEGDQEGWDKFYAAAGRPDAPEGYDFKEPEQLPDGTVYSAELDQELATLMHKGGLNRQQAATVREGLMDIVGKGALDNLEAAKQHETEREQAERAAEQNLRQEWGQAYEQRGKIAGTAINRLLSPETIAALDTAGLANNPAVVKDMYNMGVKLIGEKELIASDGELASPADLDRQIADFREKNSTALFDRSHPEHAQRTKELTDLFTRRFPEQAQQ